MLFRLAQLIRHYTSQWTLWLLNTAFAIDQLSEILLKHAQRQYEHVGARLTFRLRQGKAELIRIRNVRL